MSCMQILVAALCLVSLAVQGDAFSWPHWGRCQQLPVEQQFHLQLYLGVWYQQAGYNTESSKYNLRCVNTLYGLDSSNVVTVANNAIRNKDNRTQGINGTAEFADPSKDEGRLIVTFHPYSWLTVKGNYWILGTDYSSYAVIYSCDNFLFFFHYYNVWFLSREQHFTAEQKRDYYNNTNTLLAVTGLASTPMQGVSQRNCYV
uniref:Lipocalin/cytosolic fatty-acid binding domain-containing protein n=1 Tax=Graphocephala atropunctata TaxID=36148 RepID=A0A1B6L397_9HEMI